MKNNFPGTIRAVLFDLDGTLLDTLEDIAFSLNSVLELHGYPTHPLPDFREMVGFGMEELVKRALPEYAHDQATMMPLQEQMKAAYAGHWNVHSRPYEGIGMLLDTIDRLGLKKAILSNKPDGFTKLCADELLSAWHFDLVMGHRDGIAHKPDPQGALYVAGELGIDPADFLYIGDSGVDMQTANSAGMYPFGVLWGFRTEAELREKGAASLASSPDEIVSFLDALTG